jgi:hypothetical protein
MRSGSCVLITKFSGGMPLTSHSTNLCNRNSLYETELGYKAERSSADQEISRLLRKPKFLYRVQNMGHWSLFGAS